MKLMKNNTFSKLYLKKRKAHLIALIAAVVLFVLFFSLLTDMPIRQHRSDKDQVKEKKTVELQLTFAYQNPRWNAQIVRTVEEFEEENPDIQIIYTADYEHNVYEDVLARRIARNELGDIVQLKTPDAYVAGGYLTELPYDMAEQISYSYSKNDTLWAVGALETTSGILYNKKMFAAYGLEEPKSYTDFLEICRILKENDIVPIGVAGNDLWHMEYWVNHFFRTDVLSENEDWLKDCANGSVKWTDEEAIQMLVHLKNLFSSGYVNEDWKSLGDTSLTYLLQKGEVAMVFTGPWTGREMTDSKDWEAGWFVLPDEQGNTFAAKNQDTFWALTKECGENKEKYEAAVRFLDYFYSAENYTQICDGTMTYPVVQLPPSGEIDEYKTVILDSYLRSTKRITAYIGNADCPQNFEAEYLTLIEQYLDSDRSAEEVSEMMQEVWENGKNLEEIE